MTGYVALYCRLSPRPDGSYEGVEAQERWGRAYAERRWPALPVEVFRDCGISAAGDDHRPEYERLKEWIKNGHVADIWCVEQSRLERREVQWFELAGLLDDAGLSELHTDRDGIVRVRDEVAGIKAILNAAEVRKLRRRVLDTIAEKARNGEPSGARPYGYRRASTKEGVKTLAIVPEEAEVIRESAERVLAGWSLGAIAADLATRGIKAPHGGRMIGEAVRRTLTCAAVAGKRRHGDQLYPGNWPAILDEDTWQAVRARLVGPRSVRRSDGAMFEISERHAHRGPAARKYLLTGGLSVCGVCGAPLYGSLKQARLRRGESVAERRPGIPYLLCHGSRGGRGCVGVQVEPIERHVAERLFAELDRPEFLAALGSDDGAERRGELTTALAAVDARRAELAGLWAAGDLTTAEWKAAKDRLDTREQALRAELAAVPVPVAVPDIGQVRELWDDPDGLTLDERCAFIRRFIEKITIHRAKPGTRRFDPDRVAITWRTSG